MWYNLTQILLFSLLVGSLAMWQRDSAAARETEDHSTSEKGVDTNILNI